MDKFLNIRALIGFAGISVILAIIIGSVISSHNTKEHDILVMQKLQESREMLQEISHVVNRNGSDATLQNIYKDCTTRNEYESMLVRLSTLDKRELISMQNLFETCGSNDSVRKALMVSRFGEQLSHFIILTQLLTENAQNFGVREEVKRWQTLFSLEQKKSDLLTEQTVQQSEIITLLISGKSVRSDEVTKLVEDAYQISELLSVYDHEADSLLELLVKKNAP